MASSIGDNQDQLSSCAGHSEPNLDKFTSYRHNVEMRVGIHKPYLDGHVNEVIDEAKEDNFSFVVIPLQHPRYFPTKKDAKLNTIADRSVPSSRWKSRIVLDLNHPQVDCCKQQSLIAVEKLFNNAFYLNSAVIIIDCPSTQSGCTNLATIINNKLRANPLAHLSYNLPLILFRVKIGLHESHTITASNCCTKLKKLSKDQYTGPTTNPVETSSRRNSSDLDSGAGDCSSDILTLNSPWHQWNNFREYLEPDARIGVCLIMESNLPPQLELDRWMGEPVYMVFVPIDNFITNKSNHPVLLAAHQHFLMGLSKSLSLHFSLVLTGSNFKAYPWKEYSRYMWHVLQQSRKGTIQELVDYEDTLQIPLQPLSSNLESITYETFEVDVVKYIYYQNAIEEALLYIAADKGVYPNKSSEDLLHSDFTNKKPEVTFTILVVGAGRGPLVDACLNAAKKSRLFCLLNIYVVEKNPNSIVTLHYRNKTDWSARSDGLLLRYKVTVTESDMRKYVPPQKAEIVISELLGSFSDNELSPECLDGVWQAVIPRAISIPQNYSSYMAPIHCPRLHSKVRCGGSSKSPFDSLYVVRLMNHYRWDRCQSVFSFDHANLTLNPSYFEASLFGQSILSTVPGRETPDMYSWFPCYIPLETPVFVMANQVLTVEFWRKHNEGKVWYEWVVTSPSRTRIHSMEHSNTALWKFI